MSYSLRLVSRVVAACVVAAVSIYPSAIYPSAAEEPANVLPSGHVAHIKDVTTVEGIRENMLIGYGLVVGLNGTGDKQQTVFSVQTLGNILQRMGVNVKNQITNIQVRNDAA